jgi:hypothetical protein
MSKMFDLITCGVQKSGTTTLHALIGGHPQIATSERKELHFFDTIRPGQAPDYRAYHANMRGVPEDRLWGETTPSYIFVPGALEGIKAYNPGVKLIAIFRDPAERAYSHWKMTTGRGREELSFADAIRERGRARLKGSPLPYMLAHSYVERGFYGAQLRRLLSLFPRDQVLLLAFKDLTEHRDALMARVFDFLGVEPAPPAAEDVHLMKSDRRELPDAADLAYLYDLYEADHRQFVELGGPRLIDATA